MSRLPMVVSFAVRRAATATTAAGKAIWDGKGVLLVSGAAIAAWVFRADLRRLARRLFSDDWFHGRLDWDLRERGRREDNKGARKQHWEMHRIFSRKCGGAGTR